MVLQRMQFKPGFNTELPKYANENGWQDGDKVRFRQGFPEKIGGWTKKTEKGFVGSCRALISFQTLNLENLVGLGTHLKYFIEDGGIFYDITPVRDTTSAGAVTFGAVTGSALVTATDINHGCREGDFVTFSGAGSLGGAITADVLNQEYQIQTVPTADTYTFYVRQANSPIASYYSNGVVDTTADHVIATNGDTDTGGVGTVAQYQVNTGVDTSVFGTGWGAGTYGRGSWNSAASLNVLSEILRLWQHDNFGEDLVINIRDGGIYYWDASAGTGQRAVPLSALTGAQDVPTVAKQVIVSDIDRHVIAFGCNALGSSAQDPLLIRFSDQEDPADWRPTTLNTAGDLRLGSGNAIVQAVETKQQILVFTNQTLHSMQYIGPPYTFGINLISQNISIRSPNSAIAVGDKVFWMGVDQFYMYQGQVIQLNCSVREKVLDDINLDQADKVVVGLNSGFHEIWWFYPSKGSNNINKYVVYNYDQDIWYFGSMERTAWLDSGTNDFPMSAATDGHLYFHEFGFDDNSGPAPVGLNAYIQSSPIDIGDGENFSYVRKLIPDLTFRNSTNSTPTVLYTIDAYNYNGGLQVSTDTANITKTSAIPVEQYTEKVDLRVRGRAIAVKISSDQVGTTWRSGVNRLDIRSDGKR